LVFTETVAVVAGCMRVKTKTAIAVAVQIPATSQMIQERRGFSESELIPSLGVVIDHHV